MLQPRPGRRQHRPGWLFEEFSGVSNGSTKVCNARIQTVDDLKREALVSFSIDSYSRNDSLAAPDLEVGEDDLVLRDRGYLSTGEIGRQKEAAADFICRHKTGVTYLDATSGVDREVRLNDPAGPARAWSPNRSMRRRPTTGAGRPARK